MLISTLWGESYCQLGLDLSITFVFNYLGGMLKFDFKFYFVVRDIEVSKYECSGGGIN